MKQKQFRGIQKGKKPPVIRQSSKRRDPVPQWYTEMREARRERRNINDERVGMDW